jgi:hypothetical protein
MVKVMKKTESWSKLSSFIAAFQWMSVISYF